MPILNPDGYVGLKTYELFYWTLIIMALIIIPVMIAAIWIPWRYNAKRNHDDYDPEFDDSKIISFVTIFVPLLTVSVLGTFNWIYTHRLDPYRPFGKNVQPYEIQAISLDHKWLFIYPDANIATVNEMVAPAGKPVTIRITSDPMMTSIFIPGLVSQIYAMPGMETRTNFLADNEGVFKGSNAMYSGPGFANSRFSTFIMSPEDFDGWIEAAKSGGPVATGSEIVRVDTLDEAGFDKLKVKNSEPYPVTYYSNVAQNIFSYSMKKYMPMYVMDELPTEEEYVSQGVDGMKHHEMKHDGMNDSGNN